MDVVQAGIATAAATAYLAAGVSFGNLVELLALALGTGVGVGVGLRFARTSRPPHPTPEAGTASEEPETHPVPSAATESVAPVWAPATPADPSTAATGAVLFATAVGFALIGFFCGSLSGTLVLIVLAGVHFLANGVGVTFANLITGLVSGLVAGYLVEALGRRWQLVADEFGSARQRTAVIALAAGAVMGVLVGLLDGFNLGGVVLAVVSISVVAVAASLAVPEGTGAPQNENLPEVAE